ncbi:oligosaccharide flippase family protein [Treponema pedis]|uniref:Polysaccharide biosynthesis protein n=1 Tax=Treponema pedis str. T A4 TaxID=1291379 RepID=S5ZRN0_9SPIR|nr:oligosaccharide flippase family protein [Treponema pedis]AGT42685.1 polysaccharide biosynthesis protein [Treponema pedis str. T A4]QSI03570.1 hypothetical protein DYQ05_00895 [Treponema pedis]
MKKTKSVSYVAAWNITARFFLQGISFLSAPVFTRLLTTEDYGRVAIYSAWLGILNLFIGLQTHGSIANASIKYEGKMDSYLSSIMTLSFLSFVFVLCVFVIFQKYLCRLLDMQCSLMFLLVVHTFFSFVVNFYTAKWIQFRDVEKNTIVSILISGGTVVLSIIFILYLNIESYRAKIYGMAVPQIISGFVFFIILYFKDRCFYNNIYWKFCLKLTIPLIFHYAGGIILSQSDKIMLKKIVGSDTAGIYSFGYTVALVISSIWAAFNSTWIPFYYEYKRENKREDIIIKSNNYLFIFSSITIGFILVVPEVYKVLAPSNYWIGIQLMPLIALAYYFNFLYSFPGNHEFYNEKTLFISIGTLSAAVINIICNLWLIPLYAGIGAAIATVISYVFLLVFHDFIARFFVKNFEYNFGFYIKGMLPTMTVVIAYYFTLNFWLIRWSFAMVVGFVLLRRIIRNKALF